MVHNLSLSFPVVCSLVYCTTGNLFEDENVCELMRNKKLMESGMGVAAVTVNFCKESFHGFSQTLEIHGKFSPSKISCYTVFGLVHP